MKKFNWEIYPQLDNRYFASCVIGPYSFYIEQNRNKKYKARVNPYSDNSEYPGFDFATEQEAKEACEKFLQEKIDELKNILKEIE